MPIEHAHERYTDMHENEKLERKHERGQEEQEAGGDGHKFSGSNAVKSSTAFDFSRSKLHELDGDRRPSMRPCVCVCVCV